MYVPNKCSKCGNKDFLDIHWWIVGEVKNGQATTKVDEMEVGDTVSEEQLALSVIREIRPFMHDGMTTDEFCKLLKKYFGVASRYCCDLIQRMKIELDMYCPGRQHLYFVEA